jgi:hypothetical protein
MEFLLNNKEKIEAIDITIKEFEKDLIMRLSAIDIDFDVFNADSFRSEADSQKGSHLGIIQILDKIKLLESKKDKLQQ